MRLLQLYLRILHPQIAKTDWLHPWSKIFAVGVGLRNGSVGDIGEWMFPAHARPNGRLPLPWLALFAFATLAVARTFAVSQPGYFFKLDDRALLSLESAKVVQTGQFSADTNWQAVKFTIPVKARYFCLNALSSQDGRPYAAVAELELLDANSESLNRNGWQIAYTDSEESERESDWAENALDGRPETCWHTLF